MKRLIILSTVLLLGFGLAQKNVASIKQAALESARAVLKRPPFGYPPAYIKESCPLKAERFYPGKPVFVRSLVHITPQDRQRLRRLIKEDQAKEPDFVDSTQDNFNNQDSYRVSIFDSVCGYAFHTDISTGEKELSRIGGPLRFTRQEAQRHLASTKPPTLVKALTYPPDRYMWVAGSKALYAFGEPGSRTVYRIVNRSGKPVSPLETRLKLHLSREPFTLTDGTPSAYWNFYLPVTLEPLPTKP